MPSRIDSVDEPLSPEDYLSISAALIDGATNALLEGNDLLYPGLAKALGKVWPRVADCPDCKLRHPSKHSAVSNAFETLVETARHHAKRHGLCGDCDKCPAGECAHPLPFRMAQECGHA